MLRNVVLCGLGNVGWRVLESLRRMGLAIIVVDLHATPDDPRLIGVRLIRGDCTQPATLDKADITNADGILIVTSEDLINVSAALLIRKRNPTARIVVRMFNQNLISRLGGAVKNTVALSVSALTAPLLALTAVTGESLAAFAVGTHSQQVARFSITQSSALFGKPLSELPVRFSLTVVGHATETGEIRLFGEFDPASILSEGDQLFVAGAPQNLEPLFSEGPMPNGPRRGSGFRKLYRTLRRTLSAIDLPVKVMTSLLLILLISSAVIFRFGAGLEWSDAIYQTVNVAATGGELKGENQPGWMKIFLSALKLIGAATIAGFTAIFTNYLLKARLGGALEERRIPESGHVVVCGLGNVGFRCVQELLQLGHKVVAIQKSIDNAFTATVRRMGAAVILGDATISEVLKQARCGTARAIIAATSEELANFEIALLSRELNPLSRIVVRITDPELAQAARDSAQIRYALSPPALAAPAFATALLGDKVNALIALGGRTLALVEIVADAGDPFCGRTLKELVERYGLLPLGIHGLEPFAKSGIPLDLALTAGQRLTMVLELGKLEALLGTGAN